MTNEATPEEELDLPTEDGETLGDPDAENILGLSLEPEENDDPEDSTSTGLAAAALDSGLEFTGVEDATGAGDPADGIPVCDPMAEVSAPERSGADNEAGSPMEVVMSRLNTLENLLRGLTLDFDTKLKYDEHKEIIIDKLHQELQEYKQDLLKKLVLSFVLDTIKLADDIRKWVAHFKSLEASQRDPMKLFRYLEAIPSDLEDIFYWQGVKPFSTSAGEFDPVRQRALKKIPTEDAGLDKTIAHTIRPGYEWEGKVIRQEMVAVYMHSDARKSS